MNGPLPSLTIRLEPVDGGTELTLTHEHGWNGLLDKLPVFLGVDP
ncbi:MAG TPA: hypothetical protein VM434_02805 [Beijerinckiaceae bacterium]|nr:hypothetical protein [Beijerinckiaceae bacterium]